MAKQKKVWKSVALEKSNRSAADKIRDVLLTVAKGYHDAIDDAGQLYDVLADQFEKIEALKEDREVLEMLGWFMNCSAFFEIPESEEELEMAVEELFAAAVDKFVEKAKDFEDREYVMSLMHDLVVNSVGEEPRTELFLPTHDFLSAEELEKVMQEVVSTVTSHDLENEGEIYAGLMDFADGAGNPQQYEKFAYLADPEHSNKTHIDVANAYYVTDDLVNANRVLAEVKDPTGSYEEEFLDLKVGILFKEEKQKEALDLAEKLYEKFPKEYHLMSLCQVVSPKRKEELLDAHEKFRLTVYVSPDYVNMLATLGEFERLEKYLDTYKNEIHMMDGQVREELANRLESLNRKDLAKKFRRI